MEVCLPPPAHPFTQAQSVSSGELWAGTRQEAALDLEINT